MPIFLEVIIAICGLLFSAAAVFGAIGYWKQGTTQNVLDEGNDKLNTNSLLKEQIDALKDNVDAQSKDIEDLTNKVKLLTSAIEDERKKFAETILTLQGKDPVLNEFIKSGYTYMQNDEKFTDEVKEFIVYTKLLLIRLDKFLNKESF